MQKRNILVVLLFIKILFLTNAQIFKSPSKDFSLSVEPVIGFTYGSLGEYIYAQNSSGAEVEYSYLEWEEKPLWQYGVTMCAAYKRFGATVSFDRAVSARCGNMYDSDWLGYSDVKTNYSVSENTAVENMNVNIALQYEFRPDEKLYITPVVEASYAYNSFEARNGYGWYGDATNSSSGTNVSWNDSAAHYYRSLCGIDYSRQTFYTFLGGKITCLFTPGISLCLGAFVSPYTYTYAADTHYANTAMTEGNNYHYYQDIFFKRSKLCASVSFKINSYAEAEVAASYLFGGIGKGDIYSDIDTGKMVLRSKQASGSSVEEFSFRAGCKINLF